MLRIRRSTAVLFLIACPSGALAQGTDEGALEARVWLDRGEEPVLNRGEQVRIYYRSNADAYVAIFRIDTDGLVTLLHPRAPDEDHFVRANRDYRLLFPRSPYWIVDEDPGIGYYFMVASPRPFDFSSFAYSPYDRGWQLTKVGRTVYTDPYLAVDDFVAGLIPDWETATYALDFVTYHVGQTHTYPRFLCYDCHGFRPYSAWNPYAYACASFRVVVWDDPYYYPAYRYRGTRVVFTAPQRNRPRFEVTARAPGDPPSPIVRRRDPPASRAVEYKEPASARAGAPATRPGVVAPLPTGARTAPPTSAPATQRPGLRYVPPPRTIAPTRPPARADAGTSPPATTTRRSSPSAVLAPPQRPDPTAQERPTLQRRTPSAPPVRTEPSGGSVRTPTRPPTVVRPPASRSPAAGGNGSPPSRPPTRVILPRPSPSSGSVRNRARVAPPVRQSPTTTRPSTRPTPTPTVRPRAPSTGGRPPTTARPPGGRGGTPPVRVPKRRPGGVG